MRIEADLRSNSYRLISCPDFVREHIPMRGEYDVLVDLFVEFIHPNYQEVFLKTFGRERLILSFIKGESEAVANLYQKWSDGSYHWITSRAEQVEFGNGKSSIAIEVHRKKDLEDLVSQKEA